MTVEQQVAEVLSRLDTITQRLDEQDRKVSDLSDSQAAQGEYFESVTGRMMESTERVREHARDDVQRAKDDLQYSIDTLRREVEGLERQARYGYRY